MTTDETAPKPTAVEGMKWIPSGRFLMGSEKFYPEEAPVHEVEIDGFWVDTHAVSYTHLDVYKRQG